MGAGDSLALFFSLSKCKDFVTTPPKVLLSWSSGKDSAWTLHVLRQRGEVEVVGLLTTINSHFQRVAMHGTRQASARRTGHSESVFLFGKSLCRGLAATISTKVRCRRRALRPSSKESPRLPSEIFSLKTFVAIVKIACEERVFSRYFLCGVGIRAN